jgi:hypothetical protein
MPHIGQAPGLSLSTPSHIGQKYFAAVFDGSAGGLFLDSSAWQQVELPESFFVSLLIEVNSNEAT